MNHGLQTRARLWWPIVLALALAAGAVLLRLSASRAFYDVETEKIAAHAITVDAPNASAVLWAAFKAFFRVYGRGYLLPAYVLLLPAVALGAFGLARARAATWVAPMGDPRRAQHREHGGGDRRQDPPSHHYADMPGGISLASLERTATERRFLVGLLAATFAAVIALHLLVMGGRPQVSDEFSYVFQADLVASGKVYAQSPPMPQFFQALNVVNDGRWYSKYTLGWPVLLAVGRLMRLGFAVNAAAAGLALVVLYLIGKHILGPRGGLLSVFFAGLSPGFLLPAATYFPHAVSTLFALLFVYWLLKTSDGGRRLCAVGAGAALAYLLQIRPQDAVLIFLGTIPLALHSAMRPRATPSPAVSLAATPARAASPASGPPGEPPTTRHADTPARRVLAFAPILVLFLAGAAVLLATNKVQTGSPTLLGFFKYEPGERWGFGSMGHTPVRGLWNMAYSFMRAGFWSVPFAALLALVSVAGRQARPALLALPGVLFACFYFGYYDLAGMDPGVRYFMPAQALLAVPAAGGVLVLGERWRRSRVPGADALAASLACLVAAFMAAGAMPPLLSEVRSCFERSTAIYRQVERPAGVAGRSILFLGEDPDRKNNLFVHNPWRYEVEDDITVYYLTPPENQELLRLFPDRTPYTVSFDQRAGRYQATAGLDNSETSRNYLVAARNYRYGVEDFAAAEKAYQRAISLDPRNPNPVIELAGLYVSRKDYDKALPIFQAVVSTGGYVGVRYLLGRTLGEMGRKQEAVAVLKGLLEATSDPLLKAKAEGWIEAWSETSEAAAPAGASSVR
ncbi:MAG: tetratricopeptide repeat protein [bacterium]